MALIINMPQLSDTMEEGRILQWVKSEGDDLAVGDIIAEIESDKADVEFEVFRSGVLHKILIPEGEPVPVGSPIAIVGGKDEDITETLAEAERAASKAVKGVSAPKKKAEAPPPAVAVAPDKTPAEERAAPAKAQAEAPPKEPEGEGKLLASPVAVRLAAELGVNLSAVSGTGPAGRIVKRDVEAAAAHPKKKAAPPPEAEPEAVKVKEKAPPAEVRPEAEYEKVAMSGMRKAIARRLVESKAPVPHFYVEAEVEMSQALEAKEALDRLRGTKVTVTDLLIKACGLALVKEPQINSSYHEGAIRRYKAAHVGVVVATEEGLIIPVVRDAHSKPLAALAAEVADLIERARKRKLKPAEYTGATFTISNLGMYGVEAFSAVIAPPEGAILAVGSILDKPVVRNGRVTAGKRMRLNLACDHRIIDGTAAAAFLKEVKELLENPVSLIV